MFGCKPVMYEDLSKIVDENMVNDLANFGIG